jgi:hypothetical protein
MSASTCGCSAEIRPPAGKEGEGEEGEGEQEQVADYTYEDFQLDNVCTYANNWCGWADVVGKAIVYGQMAIDLDVPPWCTTLDVTVHTCCNGFGEGLAGPNGSAAEIVVDDTVRAVPIDSTMNYHHGMYYRYESCAQFTQTFDVTGKTSIHLVLRMLNGAKLDFEKLTVRLAT